MTVIVLATVKTTSISCSVKRRVSPRSSARPSTRSISARRSLGAIPAVGSSSSSSSRSPTARVRLNRFTALIPPKALLTPSSLRIGRAALTSLAPEATAEPREPLGKDEDHEQHETPEDQLPVGEGPRDHDLEPLEDHGADHGTPEALLPADNDRHERL